MAKNKNKLKLKQKLSKKIAEKKTAPKPVKKPLSAAKTEQKSAPKQVIEKKPAQAAKAELKQEPNTNNDAAIPAPAPRKETKSKVKDAPEESPQFLTSDEEKEIIREVQKGRVEAFEKLVQSYKQKAYYVALNLVKNHEDALDLSQDAFVKAFKAMGSFQLDNAFFPWFYKIIRNHCLNHIKKNQRIRNDSLQEIEEETYQQFQDSKPRPSEQFQSDETCQLLWNAIEQLKPDFREIITLKHFHNLSYKEIAEALNIPIGTVMSRLFNARQELRDLVRNAERDK